MEVKPSIVWFRQDLRVEDNPALMAAVEKGGPIIPLFIWYPVEEGEWRPGAANCWWLHHSLIVLQKELEVIGLKLIIRQDPSLKSLKDVIVETEADAVFWNRRYEPLAIQRDALIKAELNNQSVQAKSFNGSLLFEPWEIANKQGKPFQVFTPFYKKCLSLDKKFSLLDKPKKVIRYSRDLKSVEIDSLKLLPKSHWDKGLFESWKPGCVAAKELLKRDLESVIGNYLEIRDRPDINGTSRLSPYLHFGELSPRMIWNAVKKKYGNENPSAEGYLRQIIWREFAHHLLYYFPKTPSEPLKESYRSFPWKYDELNFKAWQKGLTGYPIVDAGMRQLWHTGWMHNRVRLIVGSFLVKDLLIQWQEGAKWFWDTLVDADLANNTMGWQWISGCGADAAPYFRVFNPITQGEKFDLTGEYVRKWVPELGQLPNKWLQKPWEAPSEVLKKAGIELGVNYPYPIVDHAEARKKALEAFAKIKS